MTPELEHFLTIFGILFTLIIVFIIIIYAPEMSVKKAENNSFYVRLLNKINSLIKKFNLFSEYVKVNYRSSQKIFLLLIIINFSFGIMFLYQFEVFGEHREKAFKVESLPTEPTANNNYETRSNSDIVFGSFETGADGSPQLFSQSYYNSYYNYYGLTYQEILFSLFTGLILLFCFKII